MFVEKVIPFQYGVGRWVSGCEARCVERMRGEVVQTCFVSWLAALSRGRLSGGHELGNRSARTCGDGFPQKI
ncbi:MAG: hypothetical protein MUO29_12350 [Desulfobacterales bacterium]|nr:hypothetical protein [Desulfobacterales bacterium]